MGISFARHVKEMDRLKKFHNKEKGVLISVLKQAREKLDPYIADELELRKNIDKALAIVPPAVSRKRKIYDPYYLHRPIQGELCLRYLE